MNQRDLTLAIAKRFFLTQVESRELIKFILSRITEELGKGERVYFRGFGSFTKEKRASKKVRHPETGKIITIPERVTVDFDPSKELLKNLH
ncbi:MAG: integration host factor subunit beta [Candidatus Omnitrophica bacterium]|nr:integration host factor subunit beta [Candidatus Omnitrophota bacterium]